ncbi:transposable element Tcb2 transposase [Trichonephila clavipes]|uniref:Transposable element Tcb2 transposase n=1 Tax=Trichonephila clavipes TaxID=2585209 RepID=A0A8X6RFL0_TRICX|nr:transposable element Tcb2 transposase [Trichonephila clavipes]
MQQNHPDNVCEELTYLILKFGYLSVFFSPETPPSWAYVENGDTLERIGLNTDSLRTFKWREPGIHHLSSNVHEIDNYAGRGLMVWPGIMFDFCTPVLVSERGSVTGVRHRNEGLKPYVCLFRGACGSKFILMDGNLRLHNTLLVVEFLESEDISSMDWPAPSPDFNPVEHVWDTLGRAIVTRNLPPKPSRK